MLDFKTCPCYPVPCSELAMHLRIADKPVTAYCIHGPNDNYVTITVRGHQGTYDGLLSELLPFELREK